MRITFDEQGHVLWTPRQLFELARTNPLRLVNDFLMGGATPWAFAEYSQYCDFLHAIAERTGIHPRNLYLRGSCQIGFSIAPRSDKIWTRMSDQSDLDLVIVDRPYFGSVRGGNPALGVQKPPPGPPGERIFGVSRSPT